MKDFTVVAIYEDNMQRYATHVEANTPASAIKKARKELPFNTLLIAGVYAGKLIAVEEGSFAFEDK